MQTLPQSAVNAPKASGSKPRTSRQREELMYQAVTIAAMLIILVTVWVF
jgi:hypothetical protein